MTSPGNETGGLLQAEFESPVDDIEDTRPCCTMHAVAWKFFDLAMSIPFWYLMLFQNTTDIGLYSVLGSLLVAMVAWRLYLAYGGGRTAIAGEIPYTCGYLQADNKEVFLVATVHISPKAPKDVEAVIEMVRPDIAMIELDEERLDKMRDVDVEKATPEPLEADLQAVRITSAEDCGTGGVIGGVDSASVLTVRGQRALWNAEWQHETIEGEIAFDDENLHGLSDGKAAEGKVALYRRGAPPGAFGAFAIKAHKAARAGARAVLIVNEEGRKLPLGRIGANTMQGDLKIFLHTWSCGFPQVPVILIPHSEGTRLEEMCQISKAEGKTAPRAEMKVLQDAYPRRTLCRRLCQASALMFSGIGILYGVIQCFAVEVGMEFLAAETAASKQGIPCACIDVNLNTFWTRLGSSLVPSPCNIAASLLAWLSFPRVAFRVLFPSASSIDCLGSMFLHACSFPVLTWLAFGVSGYCASFVTSHIFSLLGFGAAQAVEQTGAVKKEDTDALQAWIMLLVQMYAMPQIYDGVAASRDEAMYRNIVSTSRKRSSKKMVVVVGAGHANGILNLVRARGL